MRSRGGFLKAERQFDRCRAMLVAAKQPIIVALTLVLQQLTVYRIDTDWPD
jgi:hypothetical protein